MYKCLMAVCSEGAAIDRETNLLSIFNIIEDVTPEGLPFLIQHLKVVFVTTRAEEDPPTIDVTVKVLVNGVEVGASIGAITFGRSLRHRYISNVSAMPINQQGIVEFPYFINGHEIGRACFAVLSPVQLHLPLKMTGPNP